MAADIDSIALDVARRFTEEWDPQRRANLQVAIIQAIRTAHAQPAELAFDVEAMLAACVPGGSIADPQVVADNIRTWAAERKPAGLAEQQGGGSLNISEGGRRYVADFFARELRRHDFTRYITTTLAADFACALAQHLAATGKQQVGEVQGDALAALESAMPYLETLHSIVGGEARASVWRCIERGRLALAARQPGAQVPVAWKYRPQRATYWRVSLTQPINERMEIEPLYAAPPAQGIHLGPGVRAIADERQRQVDAEGFSAENDAHYKAGELANAALAYVQVAAMDLAAGGRSHVATRSPPACWPWHRLWWKPKDARRDLVRAGALIAAQLDLLDRPRDAAPGVDRG